MKSKTMSAHLATLLFLFVHTLCSSQSSLSGAVTDASHQGLSAATVLLLNKADSILVKGQVTSTEGVYRFENIPEGVYFLKVSMLGMTEHLSEAFTLSATDSKKEMPPIVLAEDAAKLGEVSIVAKKPFFEQKVDRMVINVSSSATNAGNNAMQVLQRSPGILINRQTNQISMAGKNGVIIMINGKISRMPPDAILQMLEGMSADNIERIELIHTPPASFDAEGSAGIINIVLKQSAEAGLNGGYSINGGYGKREKYGAGLNFNYRQKKTNLFGDYAYRFNHNPQVFTNYRGIERDGQFLETDGYSDRSPDLAIQNARLGADFQLSPKTIVGVVGTFFDRYWDMDAKNNIDYSSNARVDSSVLMYTKEINHWYSYTGNVNFSHQFSKDKTLSADADYVYYKILNPSNYDISLDRSNAPGSEESKLRVDKENPIKIYVAKVDYTQHFGENTQFEAGLKGAASRFDNDVRVESFAKETWSVDSLLTSRFKLREDVAAAYSSVSFKINAKTDAKLGLRYEFTSTNLGSAEQPNVVDRQYGSWFPTVYLSRKISELQSLNLSYSRRIARPGFTQLAPYLIFYDPSTVQTGNPALQPSFVQAIRASYQYKSINITAEYNYEDPSIRDLPFVNVLKNTQVSRPENIGNTHTAFAFVSMPWQATKWWSMENSVFVAYQKFNIRYEGKDVFIPTRFTGFNSSQNFKLPKQFSLDLSGGMVTDNYYGLVKYKINGTLNIGIQKKFGPKWGDLTFNVNDVFLSSNYYGYVNQPELNLRVNNSFQEAERVFLLTWSNKFGNKKLREARQRQRGAADELQRL